MPITQLFKLTTESILVTNLTVIKNVADPLLRSQVFKLTTELILVTNLTDVKNVASPLPFIKSSHLLQNL